MTLEGELIRGLLIQLCGGQGVPKEAQMYLNVGCVTVLLCFLTNALGFADLGVVALLFLGGGGGCVRGEDFELEPSSSVD